MIRKVPFTLLILVCIVLSASCRSKQTTPTPEPNMPNPASVYCEQQGYKLEIITAADGSQSGVCIFPDGSSCDEWTFFRGECGPAEQSSSTTAPIETPTVLPINPAERGSSTAVPTEIPTILPIDPADYQGWWTYTHPVYNFSIVLPEDWTVEESITSDPLMSGHVLNLHPEYDVEKESIRMTFRRVGEEALLWPTGVGQGEFIPQGTLDVTGQPVQRVLLVCPTGEVTSIWYHQDEGTPNITRGDLEFGFIFSATPLHCEPGLNLGGKVQRVGEMIIASLNVE